MTPISILNALITNNHQRLQLTNPPPSLPLQTNHSANPTDWHWIHYHRPYRFGSKLPIFHDYDNNNNYNDDLLNDYNTTAANLYGGATSSTANGRNNYNTNHDNPLLSMTTQSQQPKHADHLAQLSCDSGEMILRLNFSEAFKGIVYPDHNRLSPCRFFGDGHHNYELRLPLRGCGTRQVSNLSSSRDPSSRISRGAHLLFKQGDQADFLAAETGWIRRGNLSAANLGADKQIGLAKATN